jgi:hypothetical protein
LPETPPTLVALTIQVAEEIAAEVREFLERGKTGQMEFNVDRGRVVAVELRSYKRIREPSPARMR